MARPYGFKANQILAVDTPLFYDPDNEMIWGDESSNKELIFLRGDGTSVRRQSLITGHITRFQTKLGESRIRIAKFAPESNLLCIQRNEKEVEFFDLRTSLITSTSDVEALNKQPWKVFQFNQACATNAKVENKLLGFFWSSATLLVLVSKTMFELFSFNPKALPADNSALQGSTSARAASGSATAILPALTKIREVPISVGWWTYSAIARVLLISTDPAGNRISPYHFPAGTHEVSVLQRFRMDMKNLDRINKSDVYLRQLYGQVFCILVNNASNELVFYHILSDQVVAYLTITNLPKGQIRLSFVDNIILAHSSSLKVTAIYDIRFRAKIATLIDSPVTPPLQITRPMDVGLPNNGMVHSVDYAHLDSFITLTTTSSGSLEAVDAAQTSPNGSQTLGSAKLNPASAKLVSGSAKLASNSPPGSSEAGIARDSPIVGLPGSPARDSLLASHSNINLSHSTIMHSTDVASSPSNGKDASSSIASTLTPNGSTNGSRSVSPVPPSSSTTSAGPESPTQAKLDFAKVFSYDAAQFLLPEYAVNRENGQIYRLALNFEGFVAAFSDPVRLVQFLMRRDRSKAILLKLARKMIEQPYDMRVIAEVLDRFTSALQNYVDDQKVLQAHQAQQAQLQQQQQRASSVTNRHSIAGMTSPSREGPRSGSAPFSSSPSNSQPSSIQSSAPAKTRPTTSADPWGSRRADMYVAAFKRNKGSSGPTSPHASFSNANSSSESSPGTLSPAMSPSNSLSNLPSQEELMTESNTQETAFLAASAASVPHEPQLRTRRGLAVISQQDMYTQVFLPLEEHNVPWKTLLSVLLTYVTSLTQHAQLPVDSDIYGFIIDLLVRNKQYYQMHQLLQLRVISDTLHVACQLMYLANTYPPATQLALDMFRRLKEHAYTLESLLSRGMILTALRFLKTINWTNAEAQSLVPRFLQEARNSNDPTLFYVTYNFFAQRREIFHGICDDFTKMYQSEFETAPVHVNGV